ncbi:hypothetical protein ABK040_005725 [Willaertia magna]
MSSIELQDLHFDVLLPFRKNDSIICDQLPCKIIHLDLDKLNRYCYEFKLLDNGELILNNNNVVSHFVVDRLTAIFIDNLFFEIIANAIFQQTKIFNTLNSITTSNTSDIVENVAIIISNMMTLIAIAFYFIE